MPVGYRVAESPAGTVAVCLQNFGERSCPDQGLLRERADGTGRVAITACDAAGCFVDECVPAGTYRYGLAVPFACHPASCGTSFFASATVSGALPGCVRTGPAPAPVAAVPWSAGDELVCDYGGRGSGGGCSAAGPIFAGNALALLAGLLLWRRRAAQRR